MGNEIIPVVDMPERQQKQQIADLRRALANNTPILANGEGRLVPKPDELADGEIAIEIPQAKFAGR